MILWELRDEKGYLITKEFSERKAVIRKMKLENRGSGRIVISKVFQSEERVVDPIRKYDETQRGTTTNDSGGEKPVL